MTSNQEGLAKSQVMDALPPRSEKLFDHYI